MYKGPFKGIYQGFRVLGLRVVVDGVVSPLIWVIIIIVILLITPLITIHEPRSRAVGVLGILGMTV